MTETEPGKGDTTPAEQLDVEVESDTSNESEDENFANSKPDKTNKPSERKSSVEDIDQFAVQESAEDGDTKARIEEQSEDPTQRTDDDVKGKDRNSTFEKAESFFSKNKLDLALDCYLKCIKGIERGSGFLYLPQCLHKIAEVYHLKEEDEKAIQFLKAEKIYYETALIDTQQMQDKIDEITGTGDEGGEKSELESEILRAVEYENLAQLCLDKHQYQLALEFSGKATKLYQKHYGDEHASTQRCLDLFTSVYAEVGREEYTSKLNQFESEAPEGEHSQPSEAADGDAEPTSQVRRRRKPHNQSESPTDDQSRDDQLPRENTSQEQSRYSVQPDTGSWRDSQCCLTVLWVTLVVCLLMAIILFSVVYCKLTPTSWTCHYIRVQYRAISHHLDFLAYKLSAANK